MYTSQIPYIELHDALLDYEGADAFEDLLRPWLVAHDTERRWLAEFERRTQRDRAASSEELCRLYALFRVSSLLLLNRQVAHSDGEEMPGPSIAVEGIQEFHTALGFTLHPGADFHPFFHEILSVSPAANATAPIQVVDCAWPCVMLGDMVFLRAGCGVTGGSAHVVKEIAERSTLYWTYRRRDRRCTDLSVGWGGKSQWRTSLRRDYRTPSGYHFNFGGRASLDDPRCDTGELTMEALREVLVNRCMVRTAVDDDDLYPYDFSCVEGV